MAVLKQYINDQRELGEPVCQNSLLIQSHSLDGSNTGSAAF